MTCSKPVCAQLLAPARLDAHDRCTTAKCGRKLINSTSSVRALVIAESSYRPPSRYGKQVTQNIKTCVRHIINIALLPSIAPDPMTNQDLYSRMVLCRPVLASRSSPSWVLHQSTASAVAVRVASLRAYRFRDGSRIIDDRLW
jgi:hypothetical protein